MRTFQLAVLALVVGLSLLAVRADDDSNAAPNLIPNPGFERWVNWDKPPDPAQPRPIVLEGRAPEGDSYEVEAYEMKLNPSFLTTVTMGRDGDIKHGGDYSMKIINATATDIGGVVSPQIAVNPNTTYKATFWYRGQDIVPNAGDGAGVMFWINEGAASDFNNKLKIIAHPPNQTSGTFDWQSFDVTFTTAATTGKVTIIAQLRRATGTAWFDDFSLTLAPQGK
jgi:hypothetical protein